MYLENASMNASNEGKEGVCVRSNGPLATIVYVSPKSSIQLETTLYKDDYSLYFQQYGQIIYEAWPNTGEQLI